MPEVEQHPCEVCATDTWNQVIMKDKSEHILCNDHLDHVEQVGIMTVRNNRPY